MVVFFFLLFDWLSQYLELLLSQVCEIVEKHHEECVLEACVRVLCVLCCDQYTFSLRAERVVSQLLDSTLERFNADLADVLQVEHPSLTEILHLVLAEICARLMS